MQEEKIARLTKKLEKRLAQSSTKDLESENEEKASVKVNLSMKRYT